jgi:hypothetical protein
LSKPARWKSNYLVESQSKSGGWRFGSGFGGVSGGSFSEMRFRAKAIVWK